MNTLLLLSIVADGDKVSERGEEVGEGEENADGSRTSSSSSRDDGCVIL